MPKPFSLPPSPPLPRPPAGPTTAARPPSTRPRSPRSTARSQLDQARTDRAATPARVPLANVRPNARLLDEETKLITHAIRMSAYNAETTLARLLREHYSRAADEARALLREAMRLPGDIHITGDTLHLRLDPATAARRSRAIASLCNELTATETRYPGTNLKIKYSVKGHDTT